MKFSEYTRLAKRTCTDLGEMDIYHFVLGITSEAGELASALKKHLAYGKDLDITNVAEEIGDLMWFVSQLCRILNLDFDEILEANLDKLKARYPERFDTELALNRDTEKERDAINESIRI